MLRNANLPADGVLFKNDPRHFELPEGLILPVSLWGIKHHLYAVAIKSLTLLAIVARMNGTARQLRWFAELVVFYA